MFCPFHLVQANATLNEFASLRKHSEDWIESSNYIMNSAEILSQTLPMLQVRKCRYSLHFFPDYFCLVAVARKFGDKLYSGLQLVSAVEY